MTYIGVSALIMALVIFIIDKGNLDKRKILKTVLINESEIKTLMTITIAIFLLILFQIILFSDVWIVICRIAIFVCTVVITIMIGKSFYSVLNILTNEKKKQESIDKTLVNSIKIIKKNAKDALEIKKNAKEEMQKTFLDKDYISYDSYATLGFEKKYDFILSNDSGKVKKINYNKLNVLNNRIRNLILNKNIEIEQNNKICVILKLEGEMVNKNDCIMCIDKNLKELNINYENYYTLVKENSIEEEIIENQIIDICQEFIDNINSNNIYGINRGYDEIKKIYEVFATNNVNNCLQQFKSNMREIITYYSSKSKQLIQRSFLDISFIAQKNDIYDDFKEYYGYYINLQISEKDNNILHNLLIQQRIIEKNNFIENKNNYLEYLLSIKQNIYKIWLDNNDFNKIIDNISEKDDITIYKLNLCMKRYLDYKKYPDRYLNLDIESAMGQEKEQYMNLLQQIVVKSLIILNIAEWARYKYNKTKNDKLIDFIKEILESFKYYSKNDVIELYMEFINNEYDFLDKTWELQEPENMGKCIGLQMNIEHIIVLILLKAIQDSNNDKIEFREYINKDNIHLFNDLKSQVDGITEKELRIFSIIKNNNAKNDAITYLEKIISKCGEEKIKAIREFDLTIAQKAKFEENCEKFIIQETKKSKLFTFFKSKSKIHSLNEIGAGYGYTISVSKDYLYDNTLLEMDLLAQHLCESLVNEQENRLSEDISKNANAADNDLKSVIAKFKDKEKLYILAPYITTDFNTWDAKENKYYYIYEEEGKMIKIPVEECFAARDELIIGTIESFGEFQYYKLNNQKNEFIIADIENNNNREDEYIFKLYQDIRYVPSKNHQMFKIKI